MVSRWPLWRACPALVPNLTPLELRALAELLQLAARDCEQLPIRRGARRCVRSYGEVTHG